MTNKERLDAIKGRAMFNQLAKRTGEITHSLFTLDADDYDWLIQQAERVQELELEVNDWRAEVLKWQKFYKESEASHSETKELLKSIVNQNKRYREETERALKTLGKHVCGGDVEDTRAYSILKELLEGEE